MFQSQNGTIKIAYLFAQPLLLHLFQSQNGTIKIPLTKEQREKIESFNLKMVRLK